MATAERLERSRIGQRSDRLIQGVLEADFKVNLLAVVLLIKEGKLASIHRLESKVDAGDNVAQRVPLQEGLEVVDQIPALCTVDWRKEGLCNKRSRKRYDGNAIALEIKR